MKEFDGSYYIALNFLEKYMQITSQVYESPARAVISYKWRSVQTVEAKKDTVVRYQGGIKSPILSEVRVIPCSFWRKWKTGPEL